VGSEVAAAEAGWAEAGLEADLEAAGSEVVAKAAAGSAAAGWAVEAAQAAVAGSALETVAEVAQESRDSTWFGSNCTCSASQPGLMLHST
jgi:hypothetical protein